MTKDTMKAVVFKEPYKIAVEDRPIPRIKEPEDIIVKVTYSAVCGSELHIFRVCSFHTKSMATLISIQGLEPSPRNIVMVASLQKPSKFVSVDSWLGS